MKQVTSLEAHLDQNQVYTLADIIHRWSRENGVCMPEGKCHSLAGELLRRKYGK